MIIIGENRLCKLFNLVKQLLKISLLAVFDNIIFIEMWAGGYKTCPVIVHLLCIIMVATSVLESLHLSGKDYGQEPRMSLWHEGKRREVAGCCLWVVSKMQVLTEIWNTHGLSYETEQLQWQTGRRS